MTSGSDYTDEENPAVFPQMPRAEGPPPPAGARPPAPDVLMICDAPAWARIGPVIRRLAVGLIDQAVRVSLVCDRDCPASVNLPGLQGAYVLRPRRCLDVFNPARRFNELIDYAQRARPTCIHATSVSCLETALTIKRILNVPMLVTLDTAHDDPLALLVDMLGEDCIAAAMSDRIQNALLSRGDAATRCADFVPVIRPGIHVQERHQPPFEPGAPVSMLVPEPATRGRSFQNILYAAADLLQDGINVMLFFIDVGAAETHLRRLSLRLQIHEHVTFVGRFARWPQTLSAADVVILPVPHNRVQVYPLEALAGGTLLAAAAGHCYDTIIDGKTGLEFDPRRQRDLSDKLRRTLKDPHLARSLAYAAQEKIRRDHSVSHMVNAYLALYAKLGHVRPPQTPAPR
jgi:hypothetical protein